MLAEKEQERKWIAKLTSDNRNLTELASKLQMDLGNLSEELD